MIPRTRLDAVTEADLQDLIDDSKTGVALELVPAVVDNLDRELLALTSFLRYSIRRGVAAE